MKLPIIHSLWIGNSLSNLEKLCVQSFLDHGHEFHLYVYDEIDGIPSGATVKNANEIISSIEVFQFNNSYTQFSDLFRYEMLYKVGGFWVDMDTACIKPFAFADEIVIQTHPNFLSRFINTTIGFPAGHESMQKLLTQCRNIGMPKHYFEFLRLFSQMVVEHKLERYAQPPLCFSSPVDPFLDYYPDGIDLPVVTHAVHISNSSIAKARYGKNDIFHPDSLFERLKKKHGIANMSDARVYTPQMIVSAHAERKNSRKKKLKRIRNAAAIAVFLSFAAGFFLSALITRV